ncbi:hypothetical protein CROQUDRAFT_657175 [Cronartium quercuum f. sp. fusiforme G11]|uniref:alpha-1,2-Mannosidase n=1 Tax=Cronartium quercuum f. sp. fusiforme G11 TaxID=708437 RepID=A0A9P6NGK5_9BASI|nr:hypothetical protein CROQUDRAFT_657175 [Cronartium quercuum f. sp. fusiforme G11]
MYSPSSKLMNERKRRTQRNHNVTFFRTKIRSIISILGFITIIYLCFKYFSSTDGNPKLITKFITLDKPRRLHPDDYPPNVLLNLPILRMTSNDPFDKTNRPLKSSYSPFNKSSLVYQKLHHYTPSLKPPNLVKWPTQKIVNNRKLIDHEKILGFFEANSYKLPPLPKSKDRIQWDGFKRGNRWEKAHDAKSRNQRKEWVRKAFLYVWDSYKEHAWGHDELKPISGKFDDPWSGWGATIADCLDTLLIMGLPNEYQYAREHIRTIDWSYTLPKNGVETTVPFFETVIRYLGGMISAYELSTDKLMLERAEELADWLLPAFGTKLGYPVPRYGLGTNPNGYDVGRVCIAEMGSLALEFTRLSQLTQKPYYYYFVQRITDHLDSQVWNQPGNNRIKDLFPTYIDPSWPQSVSGLYTFGGMADSYYEYLIKEYQLLGTKDKNSQYSRMYSKAIDSARENLIKTFELENSGSKKITVIGDRNGQSYTPSLDHLACFSGAMIGLGAKLLNRAQDLDLAISATDSCVWAYEVMKSGLPAERTTVFDGAQENFWEAVEYQGQIYRRLKTHPFPGGTVVDSRYLGRPETIDLKYYYLLFEDPEIISLDEYVFNTEAHPFKLTSKPSPFAIKGLDFIKDERYGTGTVLQTWSRVDVEKLSTEEKALYNQIMGQ